MKSIRILIIGVYFMLIGCTDIRNDKEEVLVEEGTQVAEDFVSHKTDDPMLESPIPEVEDLTNENLKYEEAEKSISNSNTAQDARLGFWVGYFEEDVEDGNETEMYVDEGYYWDRANKINISIDRIEDNVVIGHSVVAGNDRPFVGGIDGGKFVVSEPGDDKYDGEFRFTINGDKLKGKWKAFKKIEIQKRKYELEHKVFKYNPNQLLDYSKEYVNWNKTKEKYEDGEGDAQDFASATDLIYEINASNTLLKKEDVENLKRGDLLIIRNTIYARHGYSFKSRTLRVFFDAQEWYIPVHTDIKADFTELEKKNIELLLRYEKNAVEYYDYFGRG